MHATCHRIHSDTYSIIVPKQLVVSLVADNFLLVSVSTSKERILFHCSGMAAEDKVAILQDWLAARDRLWSSLLATYL